MYIKFKTDGDINNDRHYKKWGFEMTKKKDLNDFLLEKKFDEETSQELFNRKRSTGTFKAGLVGKKPSQKEGGNSEND
jgi:hypothetical protein